jgi:2-polyprenyl-6-methoxyphenol hydroxylase-like FAD-dependent oxidoreductase
MAAERSKVVIVGGGFGGLYTALKLKNQEETLGGVALDVTLVDAKDKFVFLPLLYELATGTASAVEVSGADAIQCGRHCVPNTYLTPPTFTLPFHVLCTSLGCSQVLGPVRRHRHHLHTRRSG